MGVRDIGVEAEAAVVLAFLAGFESVSSARP
jgi:hypothetical protein